MKDKKKIIVNVDTLKARVFDYYCKQLEEAESQVLDLVAGDMLIAKGVIDLVEEIGVVYEL